MASQSRAGTFSCLQHTVALFKSRTAICTRCWIWAGKDACGLCGFLRLALIVDAHGLSTNGVRAEGALDAKLLDLSCACFLYSSLRLCCSWLADNFSTSLQAWQRRSSSALSFHRPSESNRDFMSSSETPSKLAEEVWLETPQSLVTLSSWTCLVLWMNVFAASLGPQVKSLAACQ